MTPTITAFESSPDRGKGLARDMRVRWALEEVGQPYDVRLVSFAEMKQPAHLALHPFGQIPTYEEGDLVLFESGSIVLHLAERHAGLLPGEANARARAIAWMFAALNTVEPPIVERSMAMLFERDEAWYAQRLPMPRRSRPQAAGRTFQPPRRCRLARRRVQRRRPDDGVGAAQVEELGNPRRISEPLRLRRPRRSAARLPARLRRATGGVHRQARVARVSEAHPGRLVRIATPRARPLALPAPLVACGAAGLRWAVVQSPRSASCGAWKAALGRYPAHPSAQVVHPATPGAPSLAKKAPLAVLFRQEVNQESATASTFHAGVDTRSVDTDAFSADAHAFQTDP